MKRPYIYVFARKTKSHKLWIMKNQLNTKEKKGKESTVQGSCIQITASARHASTTGAGSRLHQVTPNHRQSYRSSHENGNLKPTKSSSRSCYQYENTRQSFQQIAVAMVSSVTTSSDVNSEEAEVDSSWGLESSMAPSSYWLHKPWKTNKLEKERERGNRRKRERTVFWCGREYGAWEVFWFERLFGGLMAA